MIELRFEDDDVAVTIRKNFTGDTHYDEYVETFKQFMLAVGYPSANNFDGMTDGALKTLMANVAEIMNKTEKEEHEDYDNDLDLEDSDLGIVGYTYSENVLETSEHQDYDDIED